MRFIEFVPSCSFEGLKNDDFKCHKQHRQGAVWTPPCSTGLLHTLPSNGSRWTDLTGYGTVRSAVELRLSPISKQLPGLFAQTLVWFVSKLTEIR